MQLKWLALEPLLATINGYYCFYSFRLWSIHHGRIFKVRATLDRDKISSEIHNATDRKAKINNENL